MIKLSDDFLDQLRRERMRKRLTIRALAKKMKGSPCYLCRVESRQANPSFKYLQRYFAALTRVTL